MSKKRYLPPHLVLLDPMFFLFSFLPFFLFSCLFCGVLANVDLIFLWPAMSALTLCNLFILLQVWLIHILIDEQLPNASPLTGRLLCGRTVALSNMIGNKILDLNNLLLLLESERSWSSLTLNKYVHL